MARSAYDTLGVKTTASDDEIRRAYHNAVKKCHPDGFTDPEQQRKGQEQLVKLNLAYESILRQNGTRNHELYQLTLEEAKRVAQRLMENGESESALKQLRRSCSRDGDWYFIEGNILFRQHKYEESHKSYRSAVYTDPDNLEYRRAALSAALMIKKQKTIFGQVRELLHRPQKK
ncbi:MAG: J domain-containing protein [Eubacteriales bacterium]|nr:J domain-containing protein [Eubacteriales bacterium]MDD3881434.1 J domain-containing protein [Eubacteriales bacterium]